MVRRILVALSVSTLGFVLLAQAAEPTAKPKNEDTKQPGVIQDEARLKQEILAGRFREFEAQLLLVAQRLEGTGKAEDREKATVLRQAIDLARNEGVDTRFNKLVDLLQKSKASNLQEVKEAIDQAEQLTANLRAILALLLTDSREAQLKAEKERLQNLLKELNRIIRDQKIVRANAERGTMDKDALAKAQDKVTKDTQNLAGQGKGNQGENKGEARGGKGKDGVAGRGEAKED